MHKGMSNSMEWYILQYTQLPHSQSAMCKGMHGTDNDLRYITSKDIRS